MSKELVTKPEEKSQPKSVAKPNKSMWQSFCQYMHEVWVEVRPNNGRVTWPTWESVKVSTKVVIISSIFLGLFIGIFDFIFAQIYTAIIGGPGIG